jgi:O-antigen ligase
MQKISNFITRYDLSSYIVFLIAGFIFLNPFPHVTALKEISFYSAIGLIGLAALLKKGGFSFDTPLSTAFVCILLWACIGILFCINKLNTIHDIYAHLIKYLAVYFMIVNYFDSREKLNALSWVIILSTSCFCLWSVSHYYFLLSHPFTDQLGVAVFKEIPTNIIGIVTIFGILLSLQKLNGKTARWIRNTLLALIILMTLATLLTQTRGALVALFLSLIILSFRNRKILIFIIAITIFVTLLPIKSRLTPSGIIDKWTHDDRMRIALTYIEVIKDFPIQGIGFGLQSYADDKFMSIYHERTDSAQRAGKIYRAPHNFVVDIMVRLGIVGLALYLYTLYRAFGMVIALARGERDDEHRGWGLTFFAALVAFLIQGMFENVHSGPPAIVFYLQLAMITILWKRYRIEQMEMGVNTT